MVQFAKHNPLKFIFQISMFIILSLLLGACTIQHQPKPIPKSVKQKKSPAPSIKNWKWPISISEGEFFRVAGWLSDDQVLYITNIEQSSNVYSYNFLSGKSELIYKSESPIVTVQISPSKKYILVQASPSSYQGSIHIVDKKGTVLWNQSIASYELAFEWNPYDESKILVSKFNEDWTFKVLLIDMNTTKMSELSIPQPFIKWVNQDTISFINWDDHHPTLIAPLVFKNLENDQEKEMFPGVFQFSTFPDVHLTITENKQDKSKSTYAFFDKKMKPIFSFTIPQLTNYSDWLVPFSDFIERKKQFITFIPLKSTEVDSYSEGFNLVSYDLKKGDDRLILKGMDNEPLNCSPLGNVCLYGNSFEKMIDLTGKKIYSLIKE